MDKGLRQKLNKRSVFEDQVVSPASDTMASVQHAGATSMPDPLQPSLLLTPLRPAAPANGGTLEVLIRVQAPDRPVGEDDATSTRKPLRLAVVVDRSGSMSGAPLREALRCAEYIAGGLQRSDQLAVVLYDDSVQVAYPLQPGGDAHALQIALAGVQSGGSTALFDGWEQGARLLEVEPPRAFRACCFSPTAKPTRVFVTPRKFSATAQSGRTEA